MERVTFFFSDLPGGSLRLDLLSELLIFSVFIQKSLSHVLFYCYDDDDYMHGIRVH